MKTSQAKTLELNKTTLIELTDQTILNINAGSDHSSNPISQRPTSLVPTAQND